MCDVPRELTCLKMCSPVGGAGLEDSGSFRGLKLNLGGRNIKYNTLLEQALQLYNRTLFLNCAVLPDCRQMVV